MNVLILSYNIPFPLNNGGAIAQYFFFEENNGIQYTFLTQANNTIEFARINALKKKCPHIVFETFKRYKRHQVILDFFRSTLSYFPRIKLFFTKLVLRKIVDETYQDTEFSEYINNYVVDKNFDWIQFEFFEGINLSHLINYKCKKIAIVHEIRSKRLELERTFSDSYIENVKTHELATLKKFNRVVVFNLKDKKYLEDNGLDVQVVISPFSIPKQMIIKNEKIEKLDHFLFLGSQFHSPNKDGLELFINNIYVNLPNHMQLPFYIIGEWEYDFKQKFCSIEKVRFLGKVLNLNDYYVRAIMVCPIISGSGIRTKILESLFNGVPVISTEIGAEGLYNQFYKDHVFIYDNLNEFITSLKTLLEFQKDDLLNFSKVIDEFLVDNFDYNEIIKTRLLCYAE